MYYILVQRIGVVQKSLFYFDKEFTGLKTKKILHRTMKGGRRQYLRISYDQDYIVNNDEIYDKKNVGL